MTKCDLQTGMRVQLRNGARYVVLKDVETCYGCKDVIFAGNGRCIFGDYNEDLTARTDVYRGDEESDIVMVFNPPILVCNIMNVKQVGELLWERKEIEEMTLSQVCAELGRDIKIIKG